MLEHDVTRAELAARLGMNDTEIRALLNPDEPSDITTIQDAINAATHRQPFPA